MQKISKWGRICSAVAFPKPGFLCFSEQWLQCFCWFVYKINQFVKFGNFLAGFCHMVNMCLPGLLQTQIEKHWSRAVFSSPVFSSSFFTRNFQTCWHFSPSPVGSTPSFCSLPRLYFLCYSFFCLILETVMYPLIFHLLEMPWNILFLIFPSWFLLLCRNLSFSSFLSL